MDCRELQLFKLFDAKDWSTAKSSDLAAINRIKYVRCEHFTIDV